MPQFSRYAIYAAPKPGPLADFAARWLGWDAHASQAVPQPEFAKLPRAVADLTQKPQKYGFHATLKAPFRLAEGQSEAALIAALEALALRLAPACAEGLRLSRLGTFLALTPQGETAALEALAAQVVQAFEPFRAPLSAADYARRRPETLSPRQLALLHRWGYPYVMEEFRLHFTLTGKLTEAEAEQVKAVLAPHITPLLPQPYRLDDLVLFGEGEAGRFQILHRAPLRGGP